MTELDGLGLAAVLAADADLEIAAAQAAIEEQKIFNPDLRTGNSK